MNLLNIEDLILSEPFLLGLETALNFTKEKKLEIKFEIKKEEDEEGFNFPNKMIIGDETSVGIGLQIPAFSRILREYGSKFGVDASHYNMSDMTKDQRFLDFADELSMKDEGIAITYPKIVGIRYSMEGYNVVEAHTHPSGIAKPSEPDLNVNGRIGFRKRPIHPVGIVIGANSSENIHEILLYQLKIKRDIYDASISNTQEFEDFPQSRASSSDEYHKCLLQYSSTYRRLSKLKGSLKHFKSS